MGPGLITSLVDDDSGGIAIYSVVGSHFGYTMLWTLLPMTVSLIMVQEMAARMGVITGKGLADLIRENYGVRITFYVMLALLIGDIGTTVSEFAGIAASTELLHLTKYLSVPLAALFVYWVVTKGTYRKVEKIFLGSALFFGTYIVSGILVHPQWPPILKELVIPSRIPIESHYLFVLIGFIGTTITPWMQFYLQSSVVEKGIRKEDYSFCRWDVILGGFMTNLITFFIIVVCAETMFKNGIHNHDAATAAMALKPLAGKYCFLLFAVGLLNASLAAAAILPLTTAFYVCEGLGWEAGVDRSFDEAPHFYTLYGVIIFLGAGIVLLPHFPLWKIMLISQVVYGVLLPPLLIIMLLLINKQEIMGDATNSKFYNLVVGATTLILIFLTILMMVVTLTHPAG